MKILITGAGGPSAISFYKAISDFECEVFMGDIDPHAAGLYLVPAKNRTLLLRGENPNFVSNILSFCIENNIDVLLPTVDFELLPLANTLETFEENGIKILLTSKNSLEICLDKFKLIETCKNTVEVPKTEIFSKDFDLMGWQFPLIIKPRSGSGSRGVKIVNNLIEFNKIDRDETEIVQEFLPGEEYSVDVLANSNGEIIASVPRVRMKVDSGIAVTSRTVFDEQLEDYGRKVAKTVGISFTANVQFRRDNNGIPKLLEVNPRFPGTMPLTVASGVNMPLLSLKNLLGEDIPTEAGVFKEIAMIRYWEEKFMDSNEFLNDQTKIKTCSND